jgi:hypothetical protein
MAKDFGVSRRRTRTAYACSFVHVLCAAVFARDVPAKAHQALDEKTNAVLRANGPQEAHQRYRDLFATAGVDGLQELKRSEHASIAMQAAWQEVALTVPAVDHIDGHRPPFRPDQGKLKWFLGFLEGRGKLRIPKWWSETVLDARANHRANFYFPRLDWGQFTTEPASQAAVTKDGQKFSLHKGNDSLDLPKELLTDLVQNGEVSSITFASAFF